MGFGKYLEPFGDIVDPIRAPRFSNMYLLVSPKGFFPFDWMGQTNSCLNGNDRKVVSFVLLPLTVVALALLHSVAENFSLAKLSILFVY